MAIPKSFEYVTVEWARTATQEFPSRTLRAKLDDVLLGIKLAAVNGRHSVLLGHLETATIENLRKRGFDCSRRLLIFWRVSWASDTTATADPTREP